MAMSRVVRVDVASYPRWKVISRNTARNEEGDVLDDRSMDSLWASTGCLETWTLGNGAKKFGWTSVGEDWRDAAADAAAAATGGGSSPLSAFFSSMVVLLLLRYGSIEE